MVRKFSVSLLGIACLLIVADVALANGGRRGGCDSGGYYGGGYGPRSYSGPYGSPYAMGDYWNSGFQRDSRAFYFSPNGGGAQIRVLVPDPNAMILFNGQPTQQMGNERLFFTPPLQAGAGNTYRIRATWRHGDKDVTQERTIDVNPGATTIVDFTRPGSEAIPDQGRPGSEPLPQNLQGRILRTGNDNFVVQTPDNREITVYTNPQTRYLINNNQAAFTDVRVGTNVNFGYTMQGNRHIANSVTISVAK